MNLFDRIRDLKEKAAKATPGPWEKNEYSNYPNGYSVYAESGCIAERWQDGLNEKQQQTLQNTGDYIATASPELITELCTALEEAREACNYVVEHEKSNLEYNPDLHRHDRYRENMYWKARAFIEKWGGRNESTDR